MFIHKYKQYSVIAQHAKKPLNLNKWVENFIIDLKNKEDKLFNCCYITQFFSFKEIFSKYGLRLETPAFKAILEKICSCLSFFHSPPARTVTFVSRYALGNIGVVGPVMITSRAFLHSSIN